MDVGEEVGEAAPCFGFLLEGMTPKGVPCPGDTAELLLLG